MKTVLSFVVVLTGLLAVKAQQYKPVDEKSEIRFTVKNFGLTTSGSLGGLKGSIKFNPSDLSTSSFEVSVDVNSINTGIDSRDDHIKKEDYFDVGRYPTVNFTSTGITQNQSDYTVTGKLTIKGVTKTISFPFTVENQDNGILLNGNFTINRKDFNVGESSAVLGNTVNVSLKVFAK